MQWMADNYYYKANIGYPYRSYEALHYLLNNFQFNTVLDIGCGEGIHSNEFLLHGKNVTAIDYGHSPYFKENKISKSIECIIGDINTYQFNRQFDCVWCSHILEHQLDVQKFLTKIVGLVSEGGVLAITVPPYKPEIGGGHVSIWNAGLLLYRLVLAGCDCRDVHIKTYDYDISVILRKKSIYVLNDIVYDMGDIRTLIKYFPEGLETYHYEKDEQFNGNIEKINW